MRLNQFFFILLFIITNNSFAQEFTIADFYSENEALDQAVEAHFNRLKPGEKVAQLIMPAIGPYGDKAEKIDAWVSEKKVGGLLLLNGTKEEFTDWVKKYNKINVENGSLPFLYSADAEASLINRKIKNTKAIPKANTLKTIEEVRQVAVDISKELNEIGINYNFAPPIDMTANKTVGWRSFGYNQDSIVSWSDAFIQTTQQHNIIATAKHFPGHGLIEGDTHKKLVYINGEMKEVKNYPPIIESGVLSVMIGHIAVENNDKYNTNNLPSSISKNIVTDLLRDELNFKGLIVTDAMNMLGVSTIQGANVKAIEAGVDILLMPLDAGKAHQEILEKYMVNSAFKAQVDTAVKRVIRAKLCVAN